MLCRMGGCGEGPGRAAGLGCLLLAIGLFSLLAAVALQRAHTDRLQQRLDRVEGELEILTKMLVQVGRNKLFDFL